MKGIMRRSVSVLLTIILLLSIFPVISFANTAKAETTYENNKGLLSALGVEISEKSEPESFISRGEFTKYTVQLLNRLETVLGDGNYFNDVKLGETNNAEYINAAVAMGFVQGNGSGYFMPENEITYAEAYKIVCGALGYHLIAESEGGYSQGYYSIVSMLDLDKGIVQSAGSVNYQDAYMLLKNMLTAEVAKLDISNKVIGQSDKTFLEYYRGIKVIKGRITANDISGLYDTKAALEKNVIIGGNSYNVGQTSADELLGYEVEAYVNIEEEELVYVAKTEKDTVYEFTGTDISDYSNQTIYCTIDDNDIKIKLDNNALINYNMVYKSNVADIDNTAFMSYLNDAYKITIVETRSGEQFVFIKEYEIIVVESVNVELGTIYQKNSRPLIKLEEDAEFDIKMLFLDEQLGLDEIFEGNVLELMKVQTATGRTRYYITIVDYPFKGTISGMGTDSNGTYYTINGIKYIVSDEFISSGAAVPTFGRRATFYLDSLGRIVAIDYTAKTNYAYLKKHYIDDEDYEEPVVVSLYTSDGEHLKLKCAEKLKCNTTTKIDSKNVLNLSPRQLITYETNNRGEVIEIYTATRLAPATITNTTPPAYDFDVFSLDYVTQVNSMVWRNYFRQEGSYKLSFGASDETIFFDIPSDLGDTKNYRVDGMSAYEEGGSVSSGAKIYDIDKLGNASVVLIERTSSSGATVSNRYGKVKVGLVKEVSEVLYDDEPCYEFSFYGGVETVYAPIDEVKYDTTTTFGYGEIDPTKLETGDLINFVIGSAGKMLSWRIMFRAKEPSGLAKNYDILAENMLQYGTVIEADGDQERRYFSIDNGEMLVNLFYYKALASQYDVNGKNIWIYDKNERTLTTGVATEIRAGDKLFIRIFNGIGQIIILIR